MLKITIFLFLIIFMGCTNNVFAQLDGKISARARAGITATILPVNKIHPDYLCFGTLVSVDVPGNIVAYLKGDQNKENIVLLSTTIPSILAGFYGFTWVAVQSDKINQSYFVDITGTGLHDIINDWLNEAITASLMGEDKLHAFTVGN